jgi:hypothetical protein
MGVSPRSRGRFMKSSAHVTAATWLSAASYGKVLGANERVRAGLIGIGLIGKRHHPRLHGAARCRYRGHLRNLRHAPGRGCFNQRRQG